MRSAVTVILALTLHVLLATCLQDHPATDQHKSCENPPVIHIAYYVNTLNQALREYDYQPRFKYYETVYDSAKKVQNKVIIPYETEVRVSCTATYTDIEFIKMTRDGKRLVWSEKHGNDIVWTMITDLFGLEYVYECTDIKTACKSSVIITVRPRLEVISPNAQMYVNDFHTNYTVRYGEPALVLCSGPDAARLVMSQNGERIQTDRENDTTIKRFVNESDLQISEYVCIDVNTTYNSTVIIKVIPNIYFESRNETIEPYYVHIYLGSDDYFTQKYYFQYSGSNISVFCSVPREVEFISREEDGTISLAENLNENTAILNMSKLASVYNYTCGDRQLSDYSKTVRVIIIPRTEVTSPSIQIGEIGWLGRDQYTITYGHPLEISCSGPDASRLKISDELGGITNGVQQTVNKTTLKYVINKAEWDGVMSFKCIEPGMDIHEKPNIRVGILPAVTDFGCVSNNLQYVNCTWTNINHRSNNILYYVENGILTEICEKPRSSGRSKFCVWDYDYDNERKMMRVLNFLIKSCCYYGCTNQTFSYDHLSIVKLAPPTGLKVFRTTPRSAVVQWNATLLYFAREYLTSKSGQLHYKVQYWYSGAEPRDVNTSLVTFYNEYCKVELNLPCTWQFYEVRIYQKLKVAIGEKYWSDPSSVSFYTDGAADNIDPTCNQEPTKTNEIMKYFVQQLRQDVRNEMQKMKQEINALHDKLANISKYMSNTKVSTD